MRFGSTNIFAIAVSALTLASASAAADASRLRGSYGFTTSAGCLVAVGYADSPTGASLPANPTPGVAFPNSGFQPNLRPNDVLTGVNGSFYYSFTSEGIRKFNGDGTGTVKGTVISVTPRPTPGPGGYPHFPPSAGSADFTFSFTYVVNADGSWTAPWCRVATLKLI